MEDGGWKLECAHSSDLRRQPRIDRGRERGGGETKKQELNHWSRKENEDLWGNAPPLAQIPRTLSGQSITGWPGGPPKRAWGAGAESQRNGWLPSPLLTAARLWQGCHPPEVLAGVIPEHSFFFSSIPPTGCCASSPGCFVLLWFGNYRRGRDPSCHPTRSPLHRGSSASPSQQLSHFFFFSFSLLSQGVGGDWQGSAAKPLSHASRWGLAPTLTQAG